MIAPSSRTDEIRKVANDIRDALVTLLRPFAERAAAEGVEDFEWDVAREACDAAFEQLQRQAKAA